MDKPLAIDLFCGLGGWAEGLLSEGWRVIGYDIERHEYGNEKYPGELVIRDVLTIHGSEFKDADLIVASPPCQEYSYMAMPWSRGKKIKAALLGKGEFPEGYKGSRTIKELTALFDACFRIQREASEAAGHYIPMIVENVRGAQEWVGKARWNFGSYYLWGDVPALMPIAQRIIGEAIKAGDRNPDGNGWSHSFADQLQGRKHGPSPGKIFSERPNGVSNHHEGTKNNGGSWFNIGSPGQKVTNQNPVHALSGFKSQGMNWSDQTNKGQDFTRLAGEYCGTKQGGDWFNQSSGPSISRTTGSKSTARKQASAMIAKIPFPLSQWIARTFKPHTSSNMPTHYAKKAYSIMKIN